MKTQHPSVELIVAKHDHFVGPTNSHRIVKGQTYRICARQKNRICVTTPGHFGWVFGWTDQAEF